MTKFARGFSANAKVQRDLNCLLTAGELGNRKTRSTDMDDYGINRDLGHLIDVPVSPYLARESGADGSRITSA